MIVTLFPTLVCRFMVILSRVIIVVFERHTAAFPHRFQPGEAGEQAARNLGLLDTYYQEACDFIKKRDAASSGEDVYLEIEKSHHPLDYYLKKQIMLEYYQGDYNHPLPHDIVLNKQHPSHKK